MHGKTFVLGATVLFCCLRLLAAYPQAETPATAEDSQESDSPQLSLADLDALMEEDSEDEEAAAVINDQIPDLLVLSAFLALALLSFFTRIRVAVCRRVDPTSGA